MTLKAEPGVPPADPRPLGRERRMEARSIDGMIDRVVKIDRVTKIVKGGKDFTYSALVVVGDGHGTIGFGSGKAKAKPAAIKKGIEIAKKNMITIALNGTTIPFTSVGQYGTGRVFLKPASEGTGVIAGGPVRVLLEAAGIQNILVKSLGTANPHNVLKATFDAFRNLRADMVADFLPDLITPAGPGDGLYAERVALRLRLVAILKIVQKQRLDMQEQVQRLITSMMPPAAVPLPPLVLQARRNAVARETLLREFGALTSTEIGELAGSKSPNRAALAHRWKSDGRIFAVLHQGGNYFPGFQFSGDCQPLAVVASIIAILTARLSPWELALWFTRRNGWLGGNRPVDLLTSEPARVVLAAEREAEGRVF